MTDATHPQITGYLDSLVPERPPELLAMERYAEENQFPIIGPAAGHYCYLTARMIGAHRVFELGSGYGYSTAWFARAVRENGGGVVHHVVWDDELSTRAKGHLEALELDDLVRYTVGEAVAALRETEGPFDLIFNDIDKQGYPAALDVVETKLRSGGVMITDNALWHGRIFDASDESAATRGVRELTDRLSHDPAWATTLVPIRDGLLLAMRV